MRPGWRRHLLAALLLLGGAALAAPADLSADDMRDAEDRLRELDSRISLQDAKALEEARELARYFQQVQAHFGARADAARGVEFSRRSQAHAEAVAKAVSAGDFDAAQDALGDLTRSCKTCHEVYKRK